MNIEDEALIDEIEPLRTIEGIIDPLEVADELEDMFLHGVQPGVSTGYANLDRYYTVKKKQWTVVTGSPSAGKSTLLDNILVNLSMLHGWKHLICSPEHQPIERHIAALVSIYAQKEFHNDAMSKELYVEGLTFIQDHFRFVYPREKDFTANHILALALEVEAEGFQFDGMVIDPYNELEHKRPVAMNETEYVSWLLSRFRRYARDNDKHFWLVAHPTKLKKIEQKFTSDATTEEMTKSIYPVPTLYDISGSAHFYNKCDNGISVWRDKADKLNRVHVHVQKIKFRECGSLGMAELQFNWHTGKYTEL